MAMRSGFLDRRPVLVGLVFLGGCLGTLIRSVIAHAWPSRADGVPWGTLAINLVGAFVLATLLELLVHAGPDRGVRRAVRLCIGTGLLGGFTTYSALTVEAGQRVMSGQWLWGIAPRCVVSWVKDRHDDVVGMPGWWSWGGSAFPA